MSWTSSSTVRARPAATRSRRSAPRARRRREITTNAARKPSRPARETSTVDTAATPAAPPISRIVSTSPDAESRCRLGDSRQRPDLHRWRAQSDRQPGEQEGREQIGDVVGVGSAPGSARASPIASSDKPVTSSLRTPTDGDEPGAGRRRRDEGRDRCREPGDARSSSANTRGPAASTAIPRKMKEKNALKAKNAERLAATSVRFLSAAAGTSGCGDRASIRTNDASRQRRNREQQQRRDRRPAVLGSPVQAVDEQQQTARHRGRPGDIEVPACRARRRSAARNVVGEADEDDPDRDVDEEHPPPAGAVGRAGRWRSRPPMPTSPPTAPKIPSARLRCCTLGEGDGQDRQRRRRDEGGAETLEPSRRDQQRRRLGDPSSERRRREDHHPSQRISVVARAGRPSGRRGAGTRRASGRRR